MNSKILLSQDNRPVPADQQTTIHRETLLHLAQAKVGAHFLDSDRAEDLIVEAAEILMRNNRS